MHGYFSANIAALQSFPVAQRAGALRAVGLIRPTWRAQWGATICPACRRTCGPAAGYKLKVEKSETGGHLMVFIGRLAKIARLSWPDKGDCGGKAVRQYRCLGDRGHERARMF